MLTYKIDKKKINQKKKKKSQVNRVNPSNLRSGSWVYDNLIKSELKKTYEAQSPINIMLKNRIEIKIKNTNQRKKHYGNELSNVWRDKSKTPSSFIFYFFVNNVNFVNVSKLFGYENKYKAGLKT